MNKVARTLVCICTAIACSSSLTAAPREFFIAPSPASAVTSPTGQLDSPFFSFEQARDAIRDIKHSGKLPPDGIIITALPGVYEFSRPFVLGETDSGDETSRIIYRASDKGRAVLRGGITLHGWRAFSEQEDSSALLPEASRSHVFVTNLRSVMTAFGDPGSDGVEVFFAGKPMTLARWPNEGFTTITDVVTSRPLTSHGRHGDSVGQINYEDERPARWTEEKDLRLHGYWFWDWSDQRMKVQSISTATKTITLAPPEHAYGYAKGQWYYAFNALSELDAAGEWYLDRDTGNLFFWPPQPIGEGDAVASVLPHLVKLNNASYITFYGFEMDAARGNALEVTSGTGVVIDNCRISNCGGNAVTIENGTSNGVRSCEIWQMGRGGVRLTGGDRTTLAPAHHFADNNRIHDYSRIDRMYNPAVSLDGVGHRVGHNLIYNAPHEAIQFGGNDHVIEFNEIHDVCRESNDAGAIYSGRNWTMRGTKIRYNYLHHITGYRDRGAVAIYLDDMYCGTHVCGNIMWKVATGVLLGGGRDNQIENNLFVDCRLGIHLDARALGWAHGHSDEWIKEARDKGTLSQIKYREAPYSVHYPGLAGIMEDQPAAPRGNIVIRNVCYGGQWSMIEEAARPHIFLQDNVITNEVSVNPDARAFRIDPEDKPFGYLDIPIDQVGPH